MPTYNFKKNLKLYVVYNGLRYQIDIYPELSFSQTFEEKAVKVKTLHAQTNMFEKAVINRANPANFEFAVPALTQNDLDILYTLLMDYNTSSSTVSLNTFDIYVEGDNDIWKLEKCVFEGAVFQIIRNKEIVVSLSGTASRLRRFGFKGAAIPGILQNRSSTRTFIVPKVMRVDIAGVEASSITSVTMEIKNSIEWQRANTLHNSLSVTSTSDTVYPDAFVVLSRTLSGTVQQYVTDENYQTVNTWATSVPLRVRIGMAVGTYLLDFNIPSVVFTNRLDVQEVIIQSYEFRMTHNPTSLSDVISI